MNKCVYNILFGFYKEETKGKRATKPKQGDIDNKQERRLQTTQSLIFISCSPAKTANPKTPR